ncbi:hypothetical protein IFM89_015305 [Coptis chinensis]|uniref:Uncharacterized protein n=1 Tax=Coptis chinensis TaxID=261450 RepID=A0A835ISM8_9MAGN|nr:hypothetical protein IFM89_015305 [Coptis chinensis]
MDYHSSVWRLSASTEIRRSNSVQPNVLADLHAVLGEHGIVPQLENADGYTLKEEQLNLVEMEECARNSDGLRQQELCKSYVDFSMQKPGYQQMQQQHSSLE